MRLSTSAFVELLGDRSRYYLAWPPVNARPPVMMHLGTSGRPMHVPLFELGLHRLHVGTH